VDEWTLSTDRHAPYRQKSMKTFDSSEKTWLELRRPSGCCKISLGCKRLPKEKKYMSIPCQSDRSRRWSHLLHANSKASPNCNIHLWSLQYLKSQTIIDVDFRTCNINIPAGEWGESGTLSSSILLLWRESPFIWWPFIWTWLVKLSWLTTLLWASPESKAPDCFNPAYKGWYDYINTPCNKQVM
jgi:hypothetical protein